EVGVALGRGRLGRLLRRALGGGGGGLVSRRVVVVPVAARGQRQGRHHDGCSYSCRLLHGGPPEFVVGMRGRWAALPTAVRQNPRTPTHPRRVRGANSYRAVTNPVTCQAS